VDAQAASLPYGQQRKIELARALLSEPLLLLLDEPAAGMNPAELNDLAELILWIRREFKVTIILIEHRMQLVIKLCERVKVLDFGQTIYEGTTSGLGQNEAVVKAYFGEDDADARH
jgi:branched-chain amino acid transport system ATP-binding protein